MTVLYKVAALKSHFDPEKKVRYHARQVKTKIMDTDGLCDIISRRTTASAADVSLILGAFRDIIPELLLENYTVHLENFGVFSLSLNSRVEDSPEKITYRSVEKVNMHFRPSVKIKKVLKGAVIRKGWNKLWIILIYRISNFSLIFNLHTMLNYSLGWWSF